MQARKDLHRSGTISPGQTCLRHAGSRSRVSMLHLLQERTARTHPGGTKIPRIWRGSPLPVPSVSAFTPTNSWPRSDMADILALRKSMRDAAAALAPAQAALDKLKAELQEVPFGSPVWRQILIRIGIETPIVLGLTHQFNDAQAAYQAAVLADPMHAADPGLPLVLLPVRIETAYLPGAAGTDLVVCVYPDDIHVDTHEPELTAAELAAGTAYWQAVWGAGPDTA